jgi:hypothetical protein
MVGKLPNGSTRNVDAYCFVTNSSTAENNIQVNPLVQNGRWINVAHTDYTFGTGFRCAYSVINGNLGFRKINCSANTRPSHDRSNYLNYSTTGILRFSSHILPDITDIFSDHLEMCHMDANMLIMQMLWTQDKILCMAKNILC